MGVNDVRNMRRSFILIYSLSILAAACNTSGIPTEFANACSLENDGRTLEVSGVLEPRTMVYCSNRSGRMECPFDLLQAAGSDKKFSADIEVGSGANTVDEIQKGFKKEDLKVRDNDGSLVAFGTDKLKLTGKLSVAPAAPGGQGVCFMKVYKIEK